MGRFNKYGTKLDMIVRGAIEEMEKAEKAEREAKRNLDKYPDRAGNVSPDYAADQARAKANHIEAAAALKATRQNVPDQTRRELRELRGKLEAALLEGFAPRPDAVDMQAVALLNSGILKPEEYVYLVREALDKGNYTMARMIGRAAEDEAKKTDSTEAAPVLRVAAMEGKEDFSAHYLRAFDDLVDIANRCLNNPAIADQWGAFTRDTIEAF